MDAFIAGNNEGFKKKRDLVMSKLEEIGIKPAVLPTGAFYVFPVVERYFGMFTPAGAKIENAMDVCLHILEQEKPLALVPGGAFGEPRCLRISYAASIPDLTEAMARMRSALEQLKATAA